MRKVYNYNYVNTTVIAYGTYSRALQEVLHVLELGLGLPVMVLVPAFLLQECQVGMLPDLVTLPLQHLR